MSGVGMRSMQEERGGRRGEGGGAQKSGTGPVWGPPLLRRGVALTRGQAEWRDSAQEEKVTHINV